MGPAANQPLAPSAKPLAHEHAPVTSVDPAPGLLEAQPGVDGQVLVHLLVGVETYLRQSFPLSPLLGEGQKLAPEPSPLVPGRDGDVVHEQVVGGRPHQQHPEHLPALVPHPHLAGPDEGLVVLAHRQGTRADALDVLRVGHPHQVADHRGIPPFGRSYAPVCHNLPFSESDVRGRKDERSLAAMQLLRTPLRQSSQNLYSTHSGEYAYPCCSGLPNKSLSGLGGGSLRRSVFPATVRGDLRIEPQKGKVIVMDIAVLAQLLSSFGTLVVATGIFYQGRQARKARYDTDRPQIIVDADYTGRFTTNVVVRNIGNGMAKNITFEFSAPIESTSGADITELPYLKHGINFMAPQTDIAAVWDSYQNVVQNLRDRGLTQGVTITSKYEGRNGESYETAWTINPLLLEGSGYSEYKGYEDEVQALEDQARALEKISEDIEEVNEAVTQRHDDGQVKQ